MRHRGLQRQRVERDLGVGEVFVVGQQQRRAGEPDELRQLGARAIDVDLDVADAVQPPAEQVVAPDAHPMRTQRRVRAGDRLRHGSSGDDTVVVGRDV